MKRLLTILVILAMVAGISFAAGEQEPAADIVKVMTWENDDANWPLSGEQPVIEFVEEKLNVDIEWQIFPHADRGTAITLMIAAGGELPDLFPAFLSSGTTPKDLAEKGITVSISDLMDAGKLPLTKAKFDKPEMVSVKNQMTDDATGKIYALPWMTNRSLLLWTDYVRGDWLDTLGLDDPTTPDEYRDMLRAFKTQDPNGNGKADEIPWQNFYGGVTWVKMFSRMFGLEYLDYSMSTYDSLYWAIINADEVVFTATDPRFKAQLEWVNTLWMEGLINQEHFNMTSPIFNASISNNTLGAQNMWPSAIVGMTEQLRQIEPDAVWHAIPYAIDPRFGTVEDSRYALRGAVSHTFLISADASEAAIRLIDYIFGDEDFVFVAEYGLKGIHHAIGADGYPHYIGKWADMDNITRRQALGSQVGRLPHEDRNAAMLQRIETDPIFEDYKEYLVKIDPYIKPPFVWKLSAKQKDITKAGLKDIQTYVDESIMKFIIGTKPFSEWDAFVETVNKEGGAEIEAAREVYQDYFDKSVKAYW